MHLENLWIDAESFLDSQCIDLLSQPLVDRHYKTVLEASVAYCFTFWIFWTFSSVFCLSSLGKACSRPSSSSRPQHWSDSCSSSSQVCFNIYITPFQTTMTHYCVFAWYTLPSKCFQMLIAGYWTISTWILISCRAAPNSQENVSQLWLIIWKWNMLVATYHSCSL